MIVIALSGAITLYNFVRPSTYNVDTIQYMTVLCFASWCLLTFDLELLASAFSSSVPILNSSFLLHLDCKS